MPYDGGSLTAYEQVERHHAPGAATPRRFRRQKLTPARPFVAKKHPVDAKEDAHSEHERRHEVNETDVPHQILVYGITRCPYKGEGDVNTGNGEYADANDSHPVRDAHGQFPDIDVLPGFGIRGVTRQI